MSKIVDEVKSSIEAVIEATSDFSTIGSLFSGDNAVRKTAELRQAVSKLRVLLNINALAEHAKEIQFDDSPPFRRGFTEKDGSFVSIRPCGKEYENKTYLGIYLGEGALSAALSVDDDKLKLQWSHTNPAIYVPDLKKIIYGIESWWEVIESPEDLRKITDMDISNVWYVKALKELECLTADIVES